MDYARDILGLRVPRVLDWSSDPNNQVGCEYIIMEKVEGTALGDVWYNLSDKSKYNKKCFIELALSVFHNTYA
ncbi:hypothetical protein LOZ55_003706 [Ophidiomyces ophidiicola]|nr:hypothetical protein LOZ55_003706 [Ophidiomyces ophidiicola]KAI1993993.1 hypothetical protein LOZ54_001180 [Ophidiomyces ophidiicola]